MAASPSPTLYRTALRGVILAAVFLAAAISAAQFGRPTVSKGPRALGLLELAPNGKGRLIPIMIMIDGEFYDASAYKASPVPMALDTGVVYEAERTGSSVGLFTISGALHGPNDTWVGQGKWQLPSAAAPKRPHTRSKPRMDDDEGPPRLRRPNSGKPTPPPSSPASSTPSATPAPSTTGSSTPAESTPQTDSDRPVLIRRAQDSASTSAPTESTSQDDSDRPVLKRPESQTAASSPAPAESEPPDDPNRPRLRRGTPSAMEHENDEENSPAPPLPLSAVKPGATKNAGKAPANAQVQILPAISDAAGPEPRPFTYDLKPDEEQVFRKKILALAAKDLLAKVNSTNPAPAHPATGARKTSRAAAPPQPTFEDLQLRVFDLTSSNEPELVLSAKARLPQSKSPTTEYFITLVARSDIYGDLHKAFSQITDAQHLDVLPRYDLIDAVDADGDGRGELLFRKVSDAGTAYVVYRVIGDQLWPLFEGTPQ